MMGPALNELFADIEQEVKNLPLAPRPGESAEDRYNRVDTAEFLLSTWASRLAAMLKIVVEAADRVSRYFDPTDGGQGNLDGDGRDLLAALARVEDIADGGDF